MKILNKQLDITLVQENTGQLEGLPTNPRKYSKDKLDRLKKSITDDPEYMEIRPVIVYPMDDGNYVSVGGNRRLQACRELHWEKVPCIVLAKDTPNEKLRAYAIKDNLTAGEDDNDILKNEWDMNELMEWGINLFDEKKKTEKEKFKERFESIKDADAVYPIIPRFDEKYETFIIVSENEVDSNWLRETLNMQRMKSYKTGKLMKSNVVHIKDVKAAIELHIRTQGEGINNAEKSEEEE